MSARDEIRFAVDALRRLPLPVARFVIRARSLARRDGDVFSLDSALRPAKLAVLLEAATGRRTVVELGTGTAWATIALAIADPERTIESWDPVVREQRERYLDLAGPGVRPRIAFVEGLGEDGPGAVAGVDLLFIDSSHEREPTLAEVATWRPVLAPGALVVFDDYGHPDYPGVADAVAELGAVGEARASLYLWPTG
jgi:predicted O-methyltransferase YrrM